MAKENNNNQKKDSKNNKKKKNPYSIYWIYVAIGLAIIGVQFFMSSSSTKEIQSTRTFYALMEKGYVEDVILWKNVGKVDFNITESGKSAIKQGDFNGPDYDIIKDLISDADGTMTGGASKFTFDIADKGNFMKKFETINDKREKNDYKPILIKLEVEHNYLSQIFGFLLPIIIIIAIWIFIMRRMSGGRGGGGGAGGHLFNIGKSKARVFEKGKGTDITFKDVAGLEEAKIEVQEIV